MINGHVRAYTHIIEKRNKTKTIEHIPEIEIHE